MRNLVLCGPILVLLACGGGSSGPAPRATALDYQDPPPGGYRFIKHPSLSTSTHLVLDLVGPESGAAARGAAVVLQAGGSGVSWAPVAGAGSPAVQPGAVFNLGGPPQFVLAKVTGGTLQAGLFQKGPGVPPAAFGADILFSVALDLGDGTPGTVALTPGRCFIQDPSGGVAAIQPALGTLALQ